ncbi:MAG: hypothetical protein KDD58_12405 [Bdellovibrionales bacterium]|nr:hypothetical protein [Bdellovibrionales bacterium]
MQKQKTFSWRVISLALFIEIISVFIVLSIFKIVDNRMWAARLASLSFLVECILLLGILWPWRYGGRGQLTFSSIAIFFFLSLFVLPMAAFRWTSDKSFIHMQWMGMDGPMIHNWSSIFYYVVVGATILDLIVAFYKGLPEVEES